MIKVFVDDSMRSKLREVPEAELCDDTGRTVGHFLSDEVYRRLLYDWANAQITDEELERRRQQPGGRTLAEIWARLDPS
jgi:hypothetical protein